MLNRTMTVYHFLSYRNFCLPKLGLRLNWMAVPFVSKYTYSVSFYFLTNVKKISQTRFHFGQTCWDSCAFTMKPMNLFSWCKKHIINKKLQCKSLKMNLIWKYFGFPYGSVVCWGWCRQTVTATADFCTCYWNVLYYWNV